MLNSMRSLFKYHKHFWHFSWGSFVCRFLGALFLQEIRNWKKQIFLVMSILFHSCYPHRLPQFVMAHIGSTLKYQRAIKMYFALSFSSFTLDMFSYLLFNFNDYPSGMVTLFNLLVMGNWQVWMEVRISQAPLSCSLLRFLPHSFGGSDTYPVVYIYPFSSFPRYSCLLFCLLEFMKFKKLN